MNAFAFCSRLEEVGGKMNTHRLSQSCVSVFSELTVTPTHILERTHSAHMSQNATSTSAHLNLPTYRFWAANYSGPP